MNYGNEPEYVEDIYSDWPTENGTRVETFLSLCRELADTIIRQNNETIIENLSKWIRKVFDKAHTYEIKYEEWRNRGMGVLSITKLP